MRLAFGTPLTVRTLVAATLGVTGVALLFLPELDAARHGGVGGARHRVRARRRRRSPRSATWSRCAITAPGLPTLPATAWGMAVRRARRRRCRASVDRRALDVRRDAPATSLSLALPRGVRQRRRVRRLPHAAEARRRRAGVVRRRRDARDRAAAVDARSKATAGRWSRARRRAGGRRQRARVAAPRLCACGDWSPADGERQSVGHADASYSKLSFASTMSFFQFARSRLDQRAEPLGRAGDELRAFALEPLAHVRLREHLLHVGVEARDDRGRRARPARRCPSS